MPVWSGKPDENTAADHLLAHPNEVAVMSMREHARVPNMSSTSKAGMEDRIDAAET